jgi:hypothetical protein
MANIKEYVSPIDKITPSQVGSEAYEIEGRHIGASFNELGHEIGGAVQSVTNELDKHAEMDDIAQSANSASTNLAMQDKNWNQTIAQTDFAKTSPSELADKQIEQTNKFWDDWVGQAKTLKGQEYRLARADSYKYEFEKKARGDSMVVSGVLFDKTASNMENNLGEAANLDGTPSGTMRAVNEAQISFDAMLKANPNLDEAERARRQEKFNSEVLPRIATAGAFGSMQRNPDQFVEDLRAGAYGNTFSATDMDHLESLAGQTKRNQIRDANTARTMAERQENDAFHGAYADLTFSTFDPKTGGTNYPPDFAQKIDQLRQMPGAERHVGELKALHDHYLADEAKGFGPGGVAPNGLKLQNYLDRVLAPAGSPNALSTAEMLKEVDAGHMNMTEVRQLSEFQRQAQADPQFKGALKQFNTFIHSYSRQFSGAGTGIPASAQQVYAWQTDMMHNFLQGYANGTWRDMLDPRNKKEFLGNYAAQYGGQDQNIDPLQEVNSLSAPKTGIPKAAPPVPGAPPPLRGATEGEEKRPSLDAIFGKKGQ